MTKVAAVVVGVALCAVTTAAQAPAVDVPAVIERASQRVTEFFTRAQSLVCLEKVSLQRLNMGWTADGPARFVESELRVSWEPSPENPMPTEAKTVRQVLRVNGGTPRKKDWQNCTT